MKFYLSSYKLGNKIEKLKKLVSATNKKVAYIPNALDFSTDLERRKKSEQSDMDDLIVFGVSVERIDLRDYFDRQIDLENKLNDFGIIWVRGGNLFVLRQAMKKSGFDKIMQYLSKKEVLYGGYSAGVCVLSPTLKGIDLMDDLTAKPYGDSEPIIWDGLGIIDYSIVPHYKSDHPESEKANEVVEYMINNKMLFKVIKDGEVIIIE
jgi:dipeptidase E